MAGSVNAVIGDDAFGTQLPETQVPQEDLTRERQMASFSKSEEFQVIKSVIESRIQFYKAYIPGNGGANNVSVQDLPNEERGWRWLAADAIIAEFSSLLQAYEQAAEAVKNETTN